MNSSPFFSVIIPTYNRASFLVKTIDSVLVQTETNFELIVVDDGSTDNTEALVAAIKDDRIRYIKQANSERGAARNKGVKEARGSYIYFLDSDDLLYKNHLEIAKTSLLKNPAKFYFQPYCIEDGSGKVIRNMPKLKDDLNLQLVEEGNYMSCHGVFLERETALQNPFNEDREMAGSEDYELWLRLAARVKIVAGTNVTSALVNHDDRSVFNFSAAKLITRKQKMLDALKSDSFFMEKYGKHFSSITSDAYSYVALHLPLDKSHHLLRWYYYKKSAAAYLPFIFSKRSLVILRQLLSGR
jgi:glycosyltransferase involved in cell wall biosynthesis